MKQLITKFSKFEEEMAIDASNVTGNYSPGEGHHMSNKIKLDTLKYKISQLTPEHAQSIHDELCREGILDRCSGDTIGELTAFFASQLKQGKTEIINKYFSEVTDELNG